MLKSTLKQFKFKVCMCRLLEIIYVIYISFILSLNSLRADIPKEQVEKLLKLSKKLRINTYEQGKCVSRKAIKKIIKKLNSNSIKKRNIAYRAIKNVLHCKQVKTYLEKHIDKISPTAKYLIYNAVAEVGTQINLPFIKRTESVEFEKRKYIDTYYPIYYSKEKLLTHLDNCGIQNNQNQVGGGRRNIILLVNKLKHYSDTGSDNYPSVECKRISIQKEHMKTSELLNLLFVCLYKYIENSKSRLYQSNKYRIFKSKLLSLFRNSVANIAIIYFSKYYDIMQDISKEGESSRYYLSDKEKFLYIEGVLLYFFSHILKKGELLNNILDTISSNDFTLTIFLNFPLIKSKQTQRHVNTIIDKLTVQRVQNSEYLLKGFLCIYYYFSNGCKDFNPIDFRTVNPITDYDKVVNIIKKCCK